MAENSALAVGIDLGTTNCALAALDPKQPTAKLDAWPIPQVTHPGEVQARALLPSFLYLPSEHELAPGALDLPWAQRRTFAVGELAREQAARVPARVITSAKSWLCHPGVDRRAEILPFGAPPEVPKLSPLAASARYLQHLREAWEHAHPDRKLEQQDVIVAVPASFDAVARDLTVEAAAQAGLPKIGLLEEPQAALYAWLHARGDAWRKELSVGDAILVCDVGGGTSDFSLIAVTEEEGNLALERIAVGDHLLLGGDNMDLALAHVVRAKVEARGKQLDTWQFHALTHGARVAKEALFADDSLAKVPIAIPGRGSSLVGGTIRAELTREELLQILVDGFFPKVEASARPASARRVGLTQLGLPYAQDAAITKHLAQFLGRQSGSDGFAKPTAILFNGGVFKARALQARVVEVLDGWLASAGAKPVRVLEGADLDLAVARGAAVYAQVRAGQGIRIRGGIARSYYVGVESAMPAVPGMAPPLKAVCVAPFGMEEGTDAELPNQEFGLVVGEPVQFRFFASARRPDDQVGTTLERWPEGELEEVAPIEANLPADGSHAGEVVPVHLHAEVTATGTLALSAAPSRQASDKRWKLEFNVRLRGE